MVVAPGKITCFMTSASSVVPIKIRPESIHLQFYNGYTNDINLFLAINYNDGTSSNASVTIPAGQIAEKSAIDGGKSGVMEYR